MDSMVERVARALAVDEYADRHGINIEAEKIEGTDHFETFYERSLGSFERPARAAIEALMEPTPEMVLEGARAIDGALNLGALDHAFRAMLSVALSDTEGR